MFILNLIAALLLQTSLPGTPAQKVVVGLEDGNQLVLENPEFSGFIQGRSGEAVLMYRKAKFHGEVAMSAVSRIEFGAYRKDRPFALTVIFRNGQKLEVETEHRDFIILRGQTAVGTVTIKHPDPRSAPLGLKNGKPNRKADLTIQYLQFPPS
jgi:hypothetical protein